MQKTEMNWFLLIAGDTYYPQADTGDWVGCFPSFDEARAQATNTSHSINGRKYDWFEIVDLREWVGGAEKERGCDGPAACSLIAQHRKH